jgi:hypothetical protein
MNFEVPYRSFWARTWRVPGVWSLADGFGDRRGREFTPTRRPPIKSGVADPGSSPGQALPLSGGGIAELAAGG